MDNHPPIPRRCGRGDGDRDGFGLGDFLMILFFDTETTGLPLFKEPSEHPDQPHIVQLAMELCEDDGTVVESYEAIVNIGQPIPAEVTAIHGITTEMSAAGIEVKQMLADFMTLAERADAFAGHNIDFDLRLIRIQCARHLGSKWDVDKLKHCTMKMATPIVNLPPTEKMVRAGFNKPKSANLGECIRHFFDEELDGAHNALVDVQACRRVYFHIKGMEKVA